MKDPRTMTAGEINKELDRPCDIANRFIEAGRGHETATVTHTLYKQGARDSLTVAFVAKSARIAALQIEVHMRCGPGCHRIPKGRGFGPRKYLP